ncbi:hypothetical protein E4K10_40680 [Streptomyces sp. T1317-0309]|nr:hypothetical protein E4K10_40680 [Streptomyces sp. T1317-0309]
MALSHGSSAGDAQRRGAVCTFQLATPDTAPAARRTSRAAYRDADVYRLSATAQAAGWRAEVPDALATAKVGERTTVNVAVAAGKARRTTPR